MRIFPPMAYTIAFKEKVNRCRIILGLIFFTAWATLWWNNILLAAPGTIIITPRFASGLASLVIGLYFFALGITRQKPYYLFYEWPATSTPIKSAKRALRELWEWLNTEQEIF